MTKYEIEVLKKWLNEAMRQLDAEVPGQTIIPGYADTDSSKEYLAEEGYVTLRANETRTQTDPYYGETETTCTG